MAARNLDAEFGRLREPTYIRPAEYSSSFLQIFPLDLELGRKLRAVTVVANFADIFAPAAVGACLLWAVDEPGNINVALEVVAQKATITKYYPRMRDMPLDGSVEAIGHPVFVNLGRARIAGELFLDSTDEGLQWMLTNKSGRYGIGLDRSEQHLANVARAFNEAGVDLRYFYYA